MVNNSLSDDEIADKGSERENRSASLSYSEAFYKHFPYYLSIGMTEEQFWDKDCTLVKYYREAEKLRRERVNEDMWIQGAYIYEVVSRISPILHAFAKKGTKAKPYLDAPYNITGKSKEEETLRKEKANSQKGLRYMEQFMAKSEIYFEGRK